VADEKASEGIFVYTTFPDPEAAEAAGERLVEEGLAACANILPGMRSIYRWKGKVERASEAVMVLKSVAGLADRLVARVTELHPYEVPAIVVLPIIGGAAPYLDWIATETLSPGKISR
jgi:periplasmic divalent cation tolerance protein